MHEFAVDLARTTALRELAQAADRLAMEHFAATPLYLATMLTTRVLPRTITIEHDEAQTMDEALYSVRRLTWIVEGPVYTDRVEELLEAHRRAQRDP